MVFLVIRTFRDLFPNKKTREKLCFEYKNFVLEK